jgi:hypothetical protein
MRAVAVSSALAGSVALVSPAPASASICGAVGWINGAAGKVCGVVSHGDQLLNAGKKLATGHIGGAAKAVVGGGGGGGGSKAAALVSLAAVGTWVLGGAKAALTDTAEVLGRTTDPRLGATWFSATYWRMAAIAAVLTLPFLFAAAVQALMRSDLALLARAALGYLPLSLLAVSIAAPLTTLLLAACDEMSAIVSSAAGHAGTHFLSRMAMVATGLVALSHSPFLVFLVALLTAAAAIALWIELLMREAAVYIVVLMLPLAFAALVWPARRIWAIRAVEMLVALILSKFAIVAVLALGGAALSTAGRLGGMLTGLVLVVLAAFAPWAMVRLLPLAELAGGAAEQLRGGLSKAHRTVTGSDEALARAENWAGAVTAGMRRQADDTFAGSSAGGERPDGARDELAKLALPSAQEPAGAVAEAGAGGEGDSVGVPEPVMVAAGAGGASGEDTGAGVGAAADGAAQDETPAPGEPSPRRWAGSIAAEQGRWQVPRMGPELLSGGTFWDPADDAIAPESSEPRLAGGDRAASGEPSEPSEPTEPGEPGEPGDEHDPRPPEQEPPEGRL